MSDRPPLLARWIGLFDRLPWLRWGLLAALTIVALLLLPSFRLNSDFSALLPDDTDTLDLFREIRGTENSARTLLIYIEADHRDALEASLPGILQSLEKNPRIDTVLARPADFAGDQIKRIRESPLLYLSDSALAQVLAHFEPEARRKALAKAKARLGTDPVAGKELLLRDPLGLRWIFDATSREASPLLERFAGDSEYLILRDQPACFIRVLGAVDPFHMAETKALMTDLDLLAADYPTLHFSFAGPYALARAEEARMRGDMERSAFGSALLILLFLTLSTRSFRLAHILLVPVGLSLLWALAYGNWSLGGLNPVCVGAFAILVGLGIDIPVHLAARYRQLRATESAVSAIRGAQLDTGPTLIATTVTTAGAFLSFLFTSFPGFQDFGILLALGLGLALLAGFLLLPWMLPRWVARPEPPPGWMVSGCTRLSTGPLRWWPVIGLLGLATLAWGILGGQGVAFDVDMRNLKPADDSAIAAQDKIESALHASAFATVALVPNHSPDTQQAIRRACEDLQRQGVLAYDAGRHRLLPAANRHTVLAAARQTTPLVHWRSDFEDDLRAAGLATTPFAPALDRLEEWLRPPPPELDSNTVARWSYRSDTHDSSIVFLYPVRSPWLRADRTNFETAVTDALTAQGLESRLFSSLNIGDEMLDRLGHEIVNALFMTSLLLVGVLLCFIPSPRLALIALLPAFTGFGLALAVFSLLGLSLNLMNMLALPLILGIGIDDGLHVTMARRRHPDHQDPYAGTGSGVWRTSVTSIIGFGSLLLVQSPGLASLGLLVLLGVATCLLTSLLVLPPLLSWSLNNSANDRTSTGSP